jgi:hypothetical protein
MPRVNPPAAAPTPKVIFVEAVDITAPDFASLAFDSAAMVALVCRRRTSRDRQRNQNSKGC